MSTQGNSIRRRPFPPNLGTRVPRDAFHSPHVGPSPAGALDVATVPTPPEPALREGPNPLKPRHPISVDLTHSTAAAGGPTPVRTRSTVVFTAQVEGSSSLS
jgi:hypothetical protein